MNNQQAIDLLKGLEQSLDDYCELIYEKVVADMRGEQDERFNQQTGGD